jgi:hypothetical protein
MVKKAAAVLCAALTVAGFAAAQASVSEEVTAFYSYGIADETQVIDSGEPGTYEFERNGYSVNANLGFNASLADIYEIVVKLNTRSRAGSPYLPLQLASASQTGFSLSLDSAYGRINLLDGLKVASAIDVAVTGGRFALILTGGKFGTGASNYNKVTRYGLESALNMIKISNDLNFGLEAVISFQEIEQMIGTEYSSLTLQLVSSGRFDEGVERLYDDDGSISTHGKVVLGEYAPQLLASLKLDKYVLPFGVLSAEGMYALNGAGIYSGHSYGASFLLDTNIIPFVLTVPVGAGVAVYEKNIDALGAQTGTGLADATIDFRNTIRAGFGLGIRYVDIYVKAAEFHLGGSFTRIEHMYRNPISLIGVAADGRFSYRERFFIGGGAILGTVSDVTWSTREGVSSMFDDYSRTFKPEQNFGYEVYGGVNIGSKVGFTLGVNNNKGLTMNYGLESVKDGLIKYRQKNTEAADRLYETFGVFMKLSMKM